MSAQQHLNRHQFRLPDELFHGTDAILKPGDLILPRSRMHGMDARESNYPGLTQDTEGTHTFATASMADAYYHAYKAGQASGGTDEYNRPPARAVYQVQPTGRMIRDREIDPEDFKDMKGQTAWQSRQPLRVVANRSNEALEEYRSQFGQDVGEDD